MVIRKGKTKVLVPEDGRPGHLCVFSRDVLTKGDGKSRDVLPGKGALANGINCDVFERLRYKGVPTAFVERSGDQFITREAVMEPYEVVVRNKATGSYRKRNPDVSEGHTFDKPLVEFYYKTTGGKIGDVVLPCDDPLAVFTGEEIQLFHPGQKTDKPLHIIPVEPHERSKTTALFDKLASLALSVNDVLLPAWREQDAELWDFKIECGWVDGYLVVADVIDFDSWRVFLNGQHLSKQLYRNDAPLDAVLKAMLLTKKLTAGFSI